MRIGWKSFHIALTDEGGYTAANSFYQSDRMNSVLTGKTSREKHFQLAAWAAANPKRFGLVRVRAWKRILAERFRDMEAAARGGNLYPMF
jgi:hypothetical protein